MLSYENKNGKWDIQIEHIPEIDGESYLFKVKGPDKKLFTYEFSFAGTAISKEECEIGTQEQRIIMGYEITKELIDKECYEDLILVRDSDKWGHPSKPQYSLKKFK